MHLEGKEEHQTSGGFKEQNDLTFKNEKIIRNKLL
jgi:hypothetical protein